MSWRRLSYIITQYFAITLFLITILLTTPWGTKLTLALLDTFDGISIDYHSGALIRDVQLNKLSLTLDQLEISVEGLATKIDFSCAWNKTLCIKSASADDFYLRYTSNANNSDKDKSSNLALKTTLVEMPFAIKINTITIKKTHIAVNRTDVYANNLQTKVAIKDNQFDFLHPAVKRLTLHLESPTDTHQSTEQSKHFFQSLPNTIAQLPDISLPLSLNIEKLKIDNITVATKSALDDKSPTTNDTNITSWQLSNNQLSASWSKSDIRIRQFNTSSDAFSVTEFTANANLASPYKIKSKLVSTIHHLAQWPELDKENLQLSLQGSLESLDMEMISTGNLTLTSAGHVNLTDPDLPFNITVDADKVSLPLSLSDYATPSSLSLASSGNLRTQHIELSSILTSYGYNNAQIKLDATHQEGHVSITQLLIDETKSDSELSLQGEVSLLPSNFAWHLSMQSTGIFLPEINFLKLTESLKTDEKLNELTLNFPKKLSGRIQGRITSEGAWSFKQGDNKQEPDKKWFANIKNTDITGTLNDTPFKIKGDIGLTPSGHISQGKLYISANSSELTLNSASNNSDNTSDNNAFWDLTGNVKIDNINQWYSAVGGTLNTDFSVKGTQDNPTIRLNAIASALNWANWHSDNLRINGEYSPMMNHQVELTINNDRLAWTNKNQTNKDTTIAINEFVFKLSGDATQHQLQTQWLGDIAGQLELTGHFDDSLTQWHSTIEKSILTYKNTSLASSTAFAVNFNLAKTTGTIGSHCWQGIGVSACLPKQALIGDIGEIAAQITVDLAVVDEFLLSTEFDLISQLNGDVKATWSPQQAIKANAEFYLSPGYITVSDDFEKYTLSQWSNGVFSLVLDNQQLTNSMQLIDINNQPLININANIQLVDDFPVDAQIALHQIDLQPFQSILAKVVNLQGKLTTDLAVNGSLKSPLVNGEISLANGKLKLEQNANVIDNLSTTLSVTDNQATLLGQFLLEGKEANLSGQLSWQDSLSINVDLNAKTLPFVFPPQLMMNVSPNLHFTYKEKTLNITGNIDVLEGSYNIETLPENSVPLSEDVIIVDQNGEAFAKPVSSINITTNVQVNIAKAFKVTGQGLQSQLLGQLQISQQEKQPVQLYGRIQSEKGVYQAYGQKLNIEKGDITFNGPTNNPYIDLRASKQIKTDDVTAGIQVTGLADALTMQLFSSPTMQTPEILSYLVRGRGLDSDTDNSTTAAGLLVGMSITNNIGLFEQIEKLPLINNLALDTEGVGDQTQATVSGYVGNRVYLKYGIGVYEPINELTVRMYMFNRFWLEIVSGIEKSTDIYYSFDIE